MRKFIGSVVLAGAMLCAEHAVPQEPRRAEAVLRFDEAKQEQAEDDARLEIAADTAACRPFVCKLNRRRVSEAEAYDAVTLWNVRRVRVKNRRMRLSDSTRREKVKLLKFFIERDRRKGVRPHLLGNVAGYAWSSSVLKNGRWHKVSPFIDTYTLRDEYDSVCRIEGRTPGFRVPENLWHTLPRDARYVLDGMPVPGGIFQFIDGLILQTLDIRNGETQSGKPVVTGTIFPDRVPLVIVSGRRSTVDSWLEMCFSNSFSPTAEVPMRYFYMLPLEAVQLYGRQGMYGAICIDLVE